MRNVSSARSGAKLKVLGYGTVALRIWNGFKWIDAHLNNTLHVKELIKYLFSLTAATARGRTIKITRNKCSVEIDGVTVTTGSKNGTLMYLNTDPGSECHVVENEVELWHRRLGHVSYNTVNRLIKQGKINGTPLSSRNPCNLCEISKQARKTFN